MENPPMDDTRCEQAQLLRFPKRPLPLPPPAEDPAAKARGDLEAIIAHQPEQLHAVARFLAFLVR